MNGQKEPYPQNAQNVTDWKTSLKQRITTLEQLEKLVFLTVEEKRAIQFSSGKFRMAITRHFASLMDKNDPECPIRRQCVPSLEEFKTSINELVDPCGEEKDCVAPGLVHRYPDRVLLLITNACSTYCRHCTRRRIVGSCESSMTDGQFEQCLEYIRENENVRDVLVSGGDPLLLSNEKLEKHLKALRNIKHVEIIRIGTRIPVMMPERINPELCSMLKEFHPVYINIHFNHPKEISEQTKAACAMLADSGIPLGSQSVLLKGINDKPSVMRILMHELVKIRVRPYYIYQCDLAQGTEHFRTPVSCGTKIIESMRGFTSGYAVPTFVIDAPGGGGKVPISPDYIISKSRKGTIFKNYEGKVFVYPESGKIIAEKELLENVENRGGEK